MPSNKPERQFVPTEGRTNWLSVARRQRPVRPAARARIGAPRRLERGFTLIELLVVMAILATLAGLGLVGIPAMMRHGKKTAVQNYLTILSANIETYKQTGQGAYPPSTLGEYAGVGNISNFENAGIESVVLCLRSRALSAPIVDLESMKEMTYANVDGDQTAVQLVSGGAKELWEILDPWGTPLAYFHSSDYGRAAEIGRVTGPQGQPIKVVPWSNPKLKTFYQSTRFQLISAGPDFVFNTEDDITNFERE
jgi:prepilin-type N-terminal cleavage/methylation domain-containing protein